MVVNVCAAVYHAAQLQIVRMDEVCDETVLRKSGIQSLEEPETVFLPTFTASSGTCHSMLLYWGPSSFAVTLDAVPDNLDHVENQCVFLPALEQR